MHQHKTDKVSDYGTQGHVIDWGWRYDLMLWLNNIFLRGNWQKLQEMIITQAQFQAGEAVLDVGCGTGTFTIEARQRVGATMVCGIDPGPKQITRARHKASRRGFNIDFQVGAIENLPFPDQSFDVVFSTFMMHVLPDTVKQSGLQEIARVLKPDGRLLIADFKRPAQGEDPERPTHTGPWNSGVQDQPQLLQALGFTDIDFQSLETATKKLPEVGFVRAKKAK